MPGIVTSYDLTVGVVINMDEAIYMLSPEDTPMLTGMGADGLSVISARPVDERVFSWMDDTILTPRSKVAAVTTGDTILTLTTGTQAKFSTGDSIYIAKAGGAGGETARITGYGTTADTLLVTRAITGSATTYASDSVIIGVGTSLAEGSDPEAARSNDRVESSNVTQIFGPTSVHMSATEQQVKKYGVANEFTHQLYKRTKENAISREQAFLYGKKFDSTTSKIRTTGGLSQFITTNVSTSTELTVVNVSAAMQLCYNQGGSPDRLMANPLALADLNDISNTGVVRVTLEDPLRGRRPVTTILTEFGPVTCTRNRWLYPYDAALFGRDNVVRRVLRPMSFEMLAKTGDSDKGQVVCEEGLEVKGEEHCARFNTLTDYSGGI